MDPAAADDPQLIASLGALASANRLAILRALRTPRTVTEIHARDTGGGPVLARQSVKRHLDTLVESGLVTAKDAQRDFGDTLEYVVNHQRIFSVSEDVRQLARLRAALELEEETIPDARIPPESARPALVLVNGLDVGTSFDLRRPMPPGGLVIGRKRGAAIALDYDAAVSSENALLRFANGRHTIEDLPGSRNGTRVNGRPLAAGEVRPLAHGDLIGVGRSLLLYWS